MRSNDQVNGAEPVIGHLTDRVSSLVSSDEMPEASYEHRRREAEIKRVEIELERLDDELAAERSRREERKKWRTIFS